MTVNLTGVTDQQTLTVTTNGVASTYTVGGSSNVNVGFLIGDVNSDGFVNVGDTIVVRSYSGATIDNTNFLNDVNLDGLINAGDTVVVKSKSGDGL